MVSVRCFDGEIGCLNFYVIEFFNFRKLKDDGCVYFVIMFILGKG